ASEQDGAVAHDDGEGGGDGAHGLAGGHRGGLCRRSAGPQWPWAAFSWPMTKTINLALQGGGAHGAFTWGVLDRLLEDGRIAFEGISATSAGAMNAAGLAHGPAAGGPAGPPAAPARVSA